MPSFLDNVQKSLRKTPTNMLLLIGCLIVLFVCYFNSSRDKEHFENGDSIIVTFYAFDYCGYCKKFKPTWDVVSNMKFPHNVEFRYYESNKLSPQQKKAIPHYVESSFAPNIVMTVNGRNVEFSQQNMPHKGLDVFIRSKGARFFNKNATL